LSKPETPCISTIPVSEVNSMVSVLALIVVAVFVVLDYLVFKKLGLWRYFLLTTAALFALYYLS
jgi:hypothetical protein